MEKTINELKDSAIQLASDLIEIAEVTHEINSLAVKMNYPQEDLIYIEEAVKQRTVMLKRESESIKISVQEIKFFIKLMQSVS